MGDQQFLLKPIFLALYYTNTVGNNFNLCPLYCGSLSDITIPYTTLKKVGLKYTFIYLDVVSSSKVLQGNKNNNQGQVHNIAQSSYTSLYLFVIDS